MLLSFQRGAGFLIVGILAGCTQAPERIIVSVPVTVPVTVPVYTQAPAPTKPVAGPVEVDHDSEFYATVERVDAKAMTIEVNTDQGALSHVMKVTKDTQFFKDGLRATFEDVRRGDKVLMNGLFPSKTLRWMRVQ